MGNHASVNTFYLLSPSFNDKTVIKLAQAHTICLTDQLSLVAIRAHHILVVVVELDLLSRHVSCSFGVTEVATHDLVASHHDVCPLARSPQVSLVALILGY